MAIGEWIKVICSTLVALAILIGGVDWVVSRRIAPLETGVQALGGRMERLEQTTQEVRERLMRVETLLEQDRGQRAIMRPQ